MTDRDDTPPPNGTLIEGNCAAVIFALLLAVTLPLVAAWELDRVAEGRLFALALPGEADPNAEELHDARAAAKAWQRPAIAVTALIGVISPFFVMRALLDWRRPEIDWALCLFLLAALTDAATTIAVFETHDITHEVHPAVKLFAYAYGRFAGTFAAKWVQVLGMLLIVRFVSSFWRLPLLLIGAVIFFVASLFNFAAVMGWW
jgi:hypothetical protein